MTARDQDNVGGAILGGWPDGFGMLLRSHRERRWLSRPELAERCGLSVRAIFNLEQGKVRRPRGDSVRLLAEALELRGDERARFEDAARGAPRSAEAALPRTTVDSATQTEPGSSAVGPIPPRQLPAAVGDFTGRASEATTLQARLTALGTAPVVLTLAGKPGVGKTALAVHVGHGVAGEFPDGQLYVNLRGAGRSPLEPAVVLDRFLLALGVHSAAIPKDVEERAALYRARLADRRVLVLLDDAAAEAQVRPLLPGTRGCAVLVTSRMRLAGLEGAVPLPLDVLPTADAVDLLARIAGPDRVAGQAATAGLLIERCGALPLAVRVVGARLATRPQWSLRRLADLLANERQRLDQLTAGDLEVRASLALSYQGLSDLQRRAFRLLGLLDVGTFAGWLAAPLLNVSIEEAERVVDDLAEASLLDLAGLDGGGDRYRFHDVVRVYAREQALTEETPDEIRQAVHRVTAGWLTLAEEADRRLPDTSNAVAVSTTPRWPMPPGLVDRLLADPLAWFDTEQANLVAAVEAAAAAEADEAAWGLASQLNTFFWIRSRAQSLHGVQTASLAACVRAGNRRGEAAMLALLGLPNSQEMLVRALKIFRELDDQRGRAAVHNMLAEQLYFAGLRRGPDAVLTESLNHSQEALRLARSFGDRMLKLDALVNIGSVLRHLGAQVDAEAVLNEALQLAVALGTSRAQAVTLWHLSQVNRQTDQYDRAAVQAKQSLAIVRRLGDRRGEAQVLCALTDIYIDQGHFDEAAAALDAARSIAIRLEGPRFHAGHLHILARLRLRQHRLSEAVDFATAAAQARGQLGDTALQASSLLLLGDALDATGSADDARRARQRALDLDADCLQPRTS